MEQAVAMFTEAVAQGHAGAQYHLALIYHEGRRVAQELDRAIELYTQSTEQGCKFAHKAQQPRHAALKNERKDVDGAEKAFHRRTRRRLDRCRHKLFCVAYFERRKLNRDGPPCGSLRSSRPAR